MKYRFVCATRLTREAFLAEAALGRWAQRFAAVAQDFEFVLFDDNRRSLSKVYNEAIEAARGEAVILIFIHDDVSILDLFWRENLRAALERFDLVGVAGTARRHVGQPSWAFLDTQGTWESMEFLSGTVAHGKSSSLESINIFGPSGRACVLLDGVLMAARSSTLIENDLRFDDRFDFHFYDIDFCRQAELKGLKMGTCPLSILHESSGNFTSDGWARGYERYLAKYGEPPR